MWKTAEKQNRQGIVQTLAWKSPPSSLLFCWRLSCSISVLEISWRTVMWNNSRNSSVSNNMNLITVYFYFFTENNIFYPLHIFNPWNLVFLSQCWIFPCRVPARQHQLYTKLDNFGLKTGLVSVALVLTQLPLQYLLSKSDSFSQTLAQPQYNPVQIFCSEFLWGFRPNPRQWVEAD